ncbi:MAG: hypothetical protein IJ928_08850 [Prevotella sp.]|nr:hypothetical protein [Prevotella sp.]
MKFAVKTGTIFKPLTFNNLQSQRKNGLFCQIFLPVFIAVFARLSVPLHKVLALGNENKSKLFFWTARLSVPLNKVLALGNEKKASSLYKREIS